MQLISIAEQVKKQGQSNLSYYCRSIYSRHVKVQPTTAAVAIACK